MIQINADQKGLHEILLDLKIIESTCTIHITDDTNCSPFESEIIVEKAKEVFAIDDDRRG